MAGSHPLVDSARLLQRFRAGERGALARLLSYVENQNPIVDEILKSVYTHTGDARVIGVTGPPGAGKSTLANALIGAFRGRGQTVGVIAVDPTSALSGGATLGDRIRMLDTYVDDGVYIRSMATRGQPGGLSVAAGRSIQVLDAFGFNVIVLETVGVGQDEIDITCIADTTLLVQIPGVGDSVQTIKAGVLEVADIIVVNKSDQPGARELVRDLRAMLRLRDHPAWPPPVVETVATAGDGVGQLMKHIDRHAAYLTESGQFTERAERRARAEIRGTILGQFEVRLTEALQSEKGLDLISDVAQRRITPAEAATQVVEHLRPRPE